MFCFCESCEVFSHHFFLPPFAMVLVDLSLVLHQGLIKSSSSARIFLSNRFLWRFNIPRLEEKRSSTEEMPCTCHSVRYNDPMEENILLKVSMNIRQLCNQQEFSKRMVHLKVHLHAPSTFQNNLDIFFSYKIFSRDRQR